MIFELKKNEFRKCSQLVGDQMIIEGLAIINGNHPGRIFVDSIESPQSGMIWQGNNDGFIFIGKEDNHDFNYHLPSFIDKVIVPDAKKVGLTWFEAIGYHSKWYKTLERIFESQELRSWNQRIYKLEKERYSGENEPCSEDGYNALTCRELYKDTSLSFKNLDFLHSKIGATWSSIDRFLEQGIGICIVRGEEIVSVCISSFVANDIHTIDVETLKAHQGKKIAQKIAFGFVKECLQTGKDPYWDVMESNKASITVAENIGFKHVLTYKGYEFPLG